MKFTFRFNKQFKNLKILKIFDFLFSHFNLILKTYFQTKIQFSKIQEFIFLSSWRV